MKDPEISISSAGMMAGDSEEDQAILVSRLGALEDKLRELPANHAQMEQALLKLEMGRTLAGLKRNDEAWEITRQLFDTFAAAGEWDHAVDACDVLFRTEQPASLAALGQGVWLAVTYPVDPELAIVMLQHIIEDTPDEADGAAVAAAVASFLVDLRASDDEHGNLKFFANQLIGQVARRHSNVESQEDFDTWFRKLELHDPELFLPRLRNVIDVLVQDDWWLDRDELQSKLPVS